MARRRTRTVLAAMRIFIGVSSICILFAFVFVVVVSVDICKGRSAVRDEKLR